MHYIFDDGVVTQGHDEAIVNEFLLWALRTWFMDLRLKRSESAEIYFEKGED